jgi:hypothetical protein
VTIGDFATTRVDGTFRLAYLVYNTITNLTTQDEQVECFRNAASHLEPGGLFVVEVGVPDLRRLPPGETTRVFAASPSYVGFDEYTDTARRSCTPTTGGSPATERRSSRRPTATCGRRSSTSWLGSPA